MDGRKNNGNKGHSTKSNGLDKRRNEYKNMLDDALTEDQLKKVVKMLYGKAINDQDTNAAKVVLEYYLGRPMQMIENTNYDGGKVIIKPKEWI